MEFKIIKYLIFDDYIEYHAVISYSSTGQYSNFSLRFSEMAALHKDLTSQRKFQLPSFPSKSKYYGKSIETIEKKICLIEDYFQALFSINDSYILQCVETFVRNKLSGFNEIKPKETETKLYVDKKEKNEKKPSIFDGKEYVIEREDSLEDSLEDTFGFYGMFDNKKKKNIIKKTQINTKENTFCRLFGFLRCCNS